MLLAIAIAAPMGAGLWTVIVSVGAVGIKKKVCLRSIATGEASCKTAADWKRSGVDL